MTTRATRGTVLALTLLALTAWTGAEAAEIRVLSTVGMQPAVSELFAEFERASGHKVVVTYGLAAVLKQSFADGNYVIVHVHAVREPGTRGNAIIDIFRLDDKGKVVEHWDAVQPIPETAQNTNTMF